VGEGCRGARVLCHDKRRTEVAVAVDPSLQLSEKRGSTP